MPKMTFPASGPRTTKNATLYKHAKKTMDLVDEAQFDVQISGRHTEDTAEFRGLMDRRDTPLPGHEPEESGPLKATCRFNVGKERGTVFEGTVKRRVRYKDFSRSHFMQTVMHPLSKTETPLLKSYSSGGGEGDEQLPLTTVEIDKTTGDITVDYRGPLAKSDTEYAPVGLRGDIEVFGKKPPKDSEQLAEWNATQDLKKETDSLIEKMILLDNSSLDLCKEPGVVVVSESQKVGRDNPDLRTDEYALNFDPETKEAQSFSRVTLADSKRISKTESMEIDGNLRSYTWGVPGHGADVLVAYPDGSMHTESYEKLQVENRLKPGKLEAQAELVEGRVREAKAEHLAGEREEWQAKPWYKRVFSSSP